MHCSVCLCVCRQEEGARHHYICLWATMCLSVIELMTFVKAGNVFRHSAISLSPFFIFIFSIFHTEFQCSFCPWIISFIPCWPLTHRDLPASICGQFLRRFLKMLTWVYSLLFVFNVMQMHVRSIYFIISLISMLSFCMVDLSILDRVVLQSLTILWF